MYIATTPGVSQFTYCFLDSAGNTVGQLRWPEVAVATNARLKRVVPKSLDRKFVLEAGNESFEIEFEYLSRGMENDIRFRLTQNQQCLASADVLQPKSLLGRRPTMQLVAPFSAHLVNRGRWYRLRYELLQEDQTQGAIYESALFSLKRTITIDLPESIAPPIQFFLFFLVVNLAY